MIVDGLLIDAQTLYWVSANYSSEDFIMQNAVQKVINTAALTGARTASVSIAAYSAGVVQILQKRLIDLGYKTASISTTTLTVTWD
jgi:hypothetical protein